MFFYQVIFQLKTFLKTLWATFQYANILVQLRIYKSSTPPSLFDYAQSAETIVKVMPKIFKKINLHFS